MPDSLLRAGTCNVRTLSGRMGAVMDMATEAGIHILCLQETKLTSGGIHALRQAFRHRGWRFVPGELHFDQQGKASGGVAIVGGAGGLSPGCFPPWSHHGGQGP